MQGLGVKKMAETLFRYRALVTASRLSCLTVTLWACVWAPLCLVVYVVLYYLYLLLYTIVFLCSLYCLINKYFCFLSYASHRRKVQFFQLLLYNFFVGSKTYTLSVIVRRSNVGVIYVKIY